MEPVPVGVRLMVLSLFSPVEWTRLVSLRDLTSCSECSCQRTTGPTTKATHTYKHDEIENGVADDASSSELGLLHGIDGRANLPTASLLVKAELKKG